jgi:histone-lysine N-methyltransferase SETMAR
LTQYHAEGEEFLARIVMKDETWVYYYEQESKRQSMEWPQTSFPAKKKFKSAPSARKLMLTLFWDTNGPSLIHYQEKGETVNSVRYRTMLEEKRYRTMLEEKLYRTMLEEKLYKTMLEEKLYSTILEEKLKPAIRSHHQKGIVLLHDNAQQHTAAAAITIIQKLKFETINHPTYSLDLVPSDYHVFGTLKETLRGKRFHSNDKVKEMVHSGFDNTQNPFVLLEYRSLSKDVKSALQRMVTMWKNDILFGTVYMMCISI